MAENPGKGMAALPVLGVVDLEELFLTAQGMIDDEGGMHGFFYTDEEDSDSDEDEEVEDNEYDSGRLTEKAKRYQREFRKYVERIRQDLSEMGYGPKAGGKDARDTHNSRKEKAKDPESEIRPIERGHKFGCGCRGCSAFRESFFNDGITDFSITDSRKTLSIIRERKSYVREHKENPGDYPCGGKMRGMFRHGFLKYALSGVDKKPGMMRYLAV